MKKVVIVFPKLEPHKDYHHVPFSALAVASKLCYEGINVTIHDERVHPEEWLYDKLNNNATTLFVTAYTGYQVSRAYEISKNVKEKFPHIHIVWGGPHVTILPEQTLQSEYLDEIIPGYFETGECLIRWDLINIDNYIGPKNRFIYMSSYGCPGICTFCSTIPKREWKELPLIKMKIDIENMMKLHKFDEVIVFDATMFTRPKRTIDIACIMKSNNLKWIANARAGELINYEYMNMANIVSSGLIQLTVGLESGSNDVLKMMKKMKKGNNHIENFIHSAKLLSEFDVIMSSGVVLGCPGETAADLLQTIRIIKQTHDINPNFRISTTFFKPLPGTQMAEIAKTYGYKEPTSLEEWANVGESSHYKYNEFQDAPWIKDIDEYKYVYDCFKDECKDYFI